MTYCLGIRLNAGMVFLSDSRTNAGMDQVSTFRKMIIYEKPGDRFMVMLSAGNLSVSQSIRELLQVESLKDGPGDPPLTIWNAVSMFDVARVLGATVRRVNNDDGDALQKAGIEFNPALILGGQIRGEAMRMFHVYSAGNFIEATRETCYLQIGESKYGKPVLDRAIGFDTDLYDGLKIGLISMDSTMRSNLGVGLPIDILVVRRDSCTAEVNYRIEPGEPYFQDLRERWSAALRAAHISIPRPPYRSSN